MSDAIDIVTAVESDPAMQTFIGDRIHPVVLPIDAVLPAITYGLVSQPTSRTQNGDQYRQPRWRFKLWSQRYRDLQPMAVALAAIFGDPAQTPFAMGSWIEYPTSNSEGHEEKTNRYWRAVDVVASPATPAGSISQ